MKYAMDFIKSIIIGLLISATADAANFSLKSTAYSDSGRIPALYSCDGKNISPELSWSNPPDKTQSYALIFSSPDWTTGKVYLWILFNIPATTKELAEKANEDLPAGALVGTNYYYDSEYH